MAIRSMRFSTRYSDVLGQTAAVEAARDLIELPLKHADLFLWIGAKPIGRGIILAGPPGTGKTLLARAVAGECGAHIEIVNGPALLSKWVGETEAAIRDVFERAKKFAPAVILFDEIDSIAPSRSAESAQHQVSTVAQLLVLLDGIEARGQIFVLATTNRPEHVDVALRRPGRFDQVVWMGLPDEHGRADIFEHYLRPLKLDRELSPDRLAAELASATNGMTGADIAYLCQRAAMCCVKDAARATVQDQTDIAIARHHFDAALGLLTAARSTMAAHAPLGFFSLAERFRPAACNPRNTLHSAIAALWRHNITVTRLRRRKPQFPLAAQPSPNSWSCSMASKPAAKSSFSPPPTAGHGLGVCCAQNLAEDLDDSLDHAPAAGAASLRWIRAGRKSAHVMGAVHQARCQPCVPSLWRRLQRWCGQRHLYLPGEGPTASGRPPIHLRRR
jgi:AAA+ superfamily predicted ATPase